MAAPLAVQGAKSDDVEVESQRLLSLFREGQISITDLMGPLTSSTGRSVNPAWATPTSGTNTSIHKAPACDAAPMDEHNVALVANVHPMDYVNTSSPDGAPMHYDLVVIGGGVAGLLSVIMGKALGKRCAMIEEHYMGGDCLNVGCFPSKVLIAAAQRAHEIRTAHTLGISTSEITIDFPSVMKRIRALRAKIAPIDSVARYKRDFCEEIFLGRATFSSENAVHVSGGAHGDRNITFDKAMIATGASAQIPPIKGLKDVPHLTNNNLFNLTSLPPRLIVIGAGPIGMEIAQALQRLGCVVTVLIRSNKFLPKEDPTASAVVRASMEADGVVFHNNVKFEGVEVSQEGNVTEAPFKTYTVSATIDGTRHTFMSDAILNGTGRVPNVQNLGLHIAGVKYDDMKGVLVDEYYRTTNSDVYACGDVASAFKFTHSADFSARLAIRNMFLGEKYTEAQMVIPWCTFVDPEVAHVGMYEDDLKSKGIAHETFVRPIEHVDRS